MAASGGVTLMVSANGTPSRSEPVERVEERQVTLDQGFVKPALLEVTRVLPGCRTKGEGAREERVRGTPAGHWLHVRS